MIKNILKLNSILLIALFATIVSGSLTSCQDDNGGSKGGAPYISYVRVTNPASKDSLLVAAAQGQLIAIIGGNLQNTKQVWFNDQQATTLSSTYISDNAIIVTVPTLVPSVVDNKLKLIFANGDSLMYDFAVTISKPVIDGSNGLKPNGMDCEYVFDGDTATIHGNYLYFPMTVTFTGGVSASSENGEITVNDQDLTVPNTIIKVKVPAGAQPGQIIITDNFGSAMSDFWFRDNRNIYQGFEGDPTASDPWWNLGSGSGTIISAPGAGDPPLINGNYIRQIFTGQTWWNQLFASWSAGLMGIPDEAILHPELYYLKFEVYPTKPFNGSALHIWITTMTAQNAGPFYTWSPPTVPLNIGAWNTVTIPFENISAAEGVTFPPVQSDGYFCAAVYADGTSLDCDMSFDNFRVVPKNLFGSSYGN